MADFPVLVRARELRESGLEMGQAIGIASLEDRVRTWPPEWANTLQFLVYGDFQPPNSIMSFPSLGIIVEAEKKENTVIGGAMTVVAASADVSEKSVAALVDAARRINLLLGTFTLQQWGNSGCGWWSHLTHGPITGSCANFAGAELEKLTAAILRLAPDIRGKVEAALFWIREPRTVLREGYRNDILRIYSSYWNAFECLVEAVNVIRPPDSLSRSDKQSKIEEFFRERNGELTAQNVHDCFRNIVDIGFPGKATHALQVCFAQDAGRYVNECFKLSEKQNRLYDVRNAINHGSIDAENPSELIRIEGRLRTLWVIVWRMFGCFIPFGAPIEG
jgi:hypothetical protein